MTAPSSAGAPAPLRRQKPAIRPVEVIEVRRLGPRLVEVRMAGAALEGFELPGPARHIKVFLPAPGEVSPVIPQFGESGPVWPDGAPRPTVRTYTPRRWDSASGVLDVQFVLHGAGPAAGWAAHAGPGDQLAVAGPGGRFTADLTAEQWLLAGDESAIPALATLLEAVPGEATGDVLIEVTDAEDRVDLPPTGLRISWLEQDDRDDRGTALEAAVAAMRPPAGAQVWAACEAAAVRRIRRRLLEQGHPIADMTTRGYWQRGVADHPDHDYGDA